MSNFFLEFAVTICTYHVRCMKMCAYGNIYVYVYKNVALFLRKWSKLTVNASSSACKKGSRNGPFGVIFRRQIFLSRGHFQAYRINQYKLSVQFLGITLFFFFPFCCLLRLDTKWVVSFQNAVKLLSALSVHYEGSFSLQCS